MLCPFAILLAFVLTRNTQPLIANRCRDLVISPKQNAPFRSGGEYGNSRFKMLSRVTIVRFTHFSVARDGRNWTSTAIPRPTFSTTRSIRTPLNSLCQRK